MQLLYGPFLDFSNVSFLEFYDMYDLLLYVAFIWTSTQHKIVGCSLTAQLLVA
jgi:hypothetical protein